MKALNLFIILLLINSVLGQENIVGKVIDENTSKPLVYAFVRFQNSDFGTTTDYKG
ncbi:MAG: hypothetical protein HRT66_01125, partial [Flavobacteriaceae bacterium]|nr:hypothetical protein [Flavobacteriaceae bacterium]NQX80584.1 hypothetical protein [Flavobacteriaceae bacterium]